VPTSSTLNQGSLARANEPAALEQVKKDEAQWTRRTA
jgi:hypothetical protein